jgi:hypothetical protein
MRLALEVIQATAVTTLVLAAWLAVQRAWSATFPGAAPEGDALGGRGGCGACGCEESCERGRPARLDAPEEE